MKHTSTLREIAKVITGIILADIASAVWLSSAGLFPMSILGVTWTAAMLPEILIFDIALLILLVHYGWRMRIPLSSPSERFLLILAGIIFLAVALVHLARLAFGFTVVLGAFSVPLWLSWFGVVIAAYLSYASFHFAARRK